MEDQGKRLLLAVVAAFAVMTVWMFLFPPEEPEKTQQAETTEEAADAGEEVGGGAAAPDQGRAPAAGTEGAPEAAEVAPAAEAAPTPRGDEKLYELSFDRFDAVFSSWGGALESWKLNGKRFETDDGGQIDLVPESDEVEAYPFQVAFDDSTHDIPVQSEWTMQERSDREIVFTWSSSQLRVTKKYELYPDDFLVELAVTVENLGQEQAKQALAVSMYGYQDPQADTGGGLASINKEWKAACDVGGEVSKHNWKSVAKETRERGGDVKWTGFIHSYFMAAMAPLAEEGDRLECKAYGVEGLRGGMRVDVVYPLVVVPGNKGFQRTVSTYLGPKYLDKLESISGVVGYDTGFGDAVDLGWFGFIARPLLVLLQWFQGFVVNWGIAIILLTFVVKLATLYWTTKSMRSMKEMSKLKPEIEKLQKKYKDDRQRQQVEIMNLYKAHKVNPVAGCLPMLLQMPIWFALYRMLMAAAELYNAPFIPGWIDDLTSPDPYYILPVLLMGMMFLQAKLSPSTADSTQQKIMMYGLPLMFGFFSFFFPSGLTVYILTNTVLTGLHQLWMNRHDLAEKKAKKAAAARGEEDEPDVGEARGEDEEPGPSEPEPSEPAAKTGGGSNGTAKQARSGNRNRKRGSGSKKRGGKRKRASNK